MGKIKIPRKARRKIGKLLGNLGLVRKPDYKRKKDSNLVFTTKKKDKTRFTYETVKYKNGDVYEGQIRKKKRHGFGVYLFASGDRYEGNYNMSVKEGTGNYYFRNGDSYEGEFKKNKKHGLGRYVKKSGKILQGKWAWDRLRVSLNDDQFLQAKDAEFQRMVNKKGPLDHVFDEEEEEEFESQLFVNDFDFDEKSLIQL